MLIQPYDENWAQNFLFLKQVFTQQLTGLDISIEHIGSTAVTYLAAKPIIDIDIVDNSNTAFERIKKRLEQLGYQHHGNQGILNREVFKRSLLHQQHQVLDCITHHLYVCPAHSEELYKHLTLRNYLNKNETARKAYQQLKIEIAAEAKQDKKLYAQLKETKATAFITSILEKAKSELQG
jgi:GrpB-like predicted nucleotidyltransferase (UPF0157 family)